MPFPFEIGLSTDVHELRARVRSAHVRCRPSWIDLRGLDVERHDAHGALLHVLATLGLGNAEVAASPSAVVLDWTHVESVSSSGLAFAVVAGCELLNRNVAIAMCEPQDGDVAAALDDAHLRRIFPMVSWVTCPRVECRRRSRVLTPVAELLAGRWAGTIGSFLSDLEGILATFVTDPERAGLTVATATEVFQNVVTHSNAEVAAATVVLHQFRRPAVVSIGIADGGVGVAASMLEHPRHAWMGEVADRGAMAAVLGGALTRRDGTEGGGGMARIVRRAVCDAGATVVVRSGASQATITRAGGARGGPVVRVIGHTWGWGTQTSISVPVG